MVALTLTGGLLFSGCGGGDDSTSDASRTSDASDASDTSGDASATASPSSSATSDGAETPADGETAPDDAAGADGTDADGGEANGAKPDRNQVIKGYENVITDQSPVELPADIVKQTATCFVDNIYDQASAQTLQAIADENAAGIDPNDAALFSDASVTCTEEAAG